MKTFYHLIICGPLLMTTLFSFGQHFQPVWNTPFNPMTIIVIGATLNSQSLDAFDEIGVFDQNITTGNEYCVGSISLEQPVSPEDWIQIICSMNDGTNPASPNGFVQGHDFLFRYWKNSIEIEIENIQYSFPYPGFDEHFTALGTAIVELSINSIIPETQFIILNQGWSGVSSFLNPLDLNIEQIFSDIVNSVIIVQNLDGQYYQPGGINTLINWNYEDGYFIKTNQSVIFSMTGYRPENKEISLSTGWNLLPVLTSENILVQDLFSGQLSKVQIIREAIGFSIFWPEKQITTLEYLEPGKSYLVKMFENATVVF